MTIGAVVRYRWIATVSLSSLPVRTPSEISALQDYAQIYSGAGSFFPFPMAEGGFSEVHP
jgi:hypothetical protein